jgi:quercetin dioxygenase-like cupin family protein
MKRIVATFIVTAWALVSVAQDMQVKPVLPQDLTWSTPPTNAALHAAWVIGAEQTPGSYLLRVRLEAGGRIPPHTHPDTRNSTVLSGTMYVGFGETFDATKVVAIPTGGVYVAPANVPHYVWAKDGETVYQEAGVGPTASVFFNAKP